MFSEICCDLLIKCIFADRINNPQDDHNRIEDVVICLLNVSLQTESTTFSSGLSSLTLL